eukprot:5437226-Amphidinium_carterae.1
MRLVLKSSTRSGTQESEMPLNPLWGVFDLHILSVDVILGHVTNLEMSLASPLCVAGGPSVLVEASDPCPP